MTTNDIVAQMKSRLKGMIEPRELNAIVNLVLEEVLHYSPVDVVLRGESEQDSALVKRIDTITARLQRHEPIQYILGHAHFHSHTFKVTPATLIPRPETERLVDIIVDENPHSDLKVIDLGTGSGCMAISLARALKFAQVTATDISQSALQVARENARLLRAHVVFRHADMLNMATEPEAWDIVASNPPYVCESERAAMAHHVLDHEPGIALFVPDDDALRFYRAIARYAAGSLKKGGRLYLEINQRFGSEIEQLLKQYGFDDARILNDQFGHTRFATATLA